MNTLVGFADIANAILNVGDVLKYSAPAKVPIAINYDGEVNFRQAVVPIDRPPLIGGGTEMVLGKLGRYTQIVRLTKRDSTPPIYAIFAVRDSITEGRSWHLGSMDTARHAALWARIMELQISAYVAAGGRPSDVNAEASKVRERVFPSSWRMSIWRGVLRYKTAQYVGTSGKPLNALDGIGVISDLPTDDNGPLTWRSRRLTWAWVRVNLKGVVVGRSADFMNIRELLADMEFIDGFAPPRQLYDYHLHSFPHKIFCGGTGMGYDSTGVYILPSWKYVLTDDYWRYDTL